MFSNATYGLGSIYGTRRKGPTPQKTGVSIEDRTTALLRYLRQEHEGEEFTWKPLLLLQPDWTESRLKMALAALERERHVERVDSRRKVAWWRLVP